MRLYIGSVSAFDAHFKFFGCFATSALRAVRNPPSLQSAVPAPSPVTLFCFGSQALPSWLPSPYFSVGRSFPQPFPIEGRRKNVLYSVHCFFLVFR